MCKCMCVRVWLSLFVCKYLDRGEGEGLLSERSGKTKVTELQLPLLANEDVLHTHTHTHTHIEVRALEHVAYKVST